MLLMRIFTLLVTLNFVSAIFPGQISAQQNDVNFQEFYDQLSPYGQWIDDDNYGYIWIPTAGPDFTPYLSNGYWVFTDDGWMWTSEYDWGWAAFHYGRWDYNGSYGWFWVPDNVWGPSWVTWRWSEGYYGWAPMRPGVSISISFSGYNDVPNDRWIFVRDRDIERHDIDRNYIDRKNNSRIMTNSKVLNKSYYDNRRKTIYVTGPIREDVQKIIGRTIKPISVNEKDGPGQRLTNDQIQIYRPVVKKNNNSYKPVPSKVTRLKDVKQISFRETENRTQNIQQQKGNKRNDQQDAVNLPNKFNGKENSPQQRNAAPAKNNVTRNTRPTVNKVNKIDVKKNSYQPQKLDPPRKENKKDQLPQVQNTIPLKDNGSKNHPYQQRSLDPPKKDNKIVPPLQPPKTVVPKNNNREQPPKVRSTNPYKENGNDRKTKSNSTDDKKEYKKLQ